MIAPAPGARHINCSSLDATLLPHLRLFHSLACLPFRNDIRTPNVSLRYRGNESTTPTVKHTDGAKRQRARYQALFARALGVEDDSVLWIGAILHTVYAVTRVIDD